MCSKLQIIFLVQVQHVICPITKPPFFFIDVSSRFKMVVMEFVEGEDLGSYLRNETDQGGKRNIVDQCRRVVRTLHDGNLCHGDFRDVNVLVRRNNVCLTTTGLADWTSRQNTH